MFIVSQPPATRAALYESISDERKFSKFYPCSQYIDVSCCLMKKLLEFSEIFTGQTLSLRVECLIH